MELVSLDLEATDAHVRLDDPSEVQVLVLEVSENESTEWAAYCSNGSLLLSKTIVLLKRTSTTKSFGVDAVMSWWRMPCILCRLSCNHFVVEGKFVSLV